MLLTELPKAAHDLLGIDLTPVQLAAFERYGDELIEWNASRANLTAITEPHAIEIRHFLDSLSILKAVELRAGMRVIDVGTGAGFPGLPLRILVPIQLALMEATGKKIQFLQHVSQQLGFTDVETVHARAEDAGQDRRQREHYDLVLARSVAHMPILMEYLLPLAKVGGQCIAMKGASAEDEIRLAEPAIKLLGGKFAALLPITLPTLTEPHFLVVIDKVAPTPARFPRKPGIPSKIPLGVRDE